MLALAPVMRAEALALENSAVLSASVVGADQKPVDAVVVRVVDLDTADEVARAITDATGSVTLPELPFGTYLVSASAPEGLVSSNGAIVSFDAAATAARLNFALMPAKASVPQEEGQEGAEGETQAVEQGDTMCSDGTDNDGDGLIDSDDPDCDDESALPLILLGVIGAAGIGIGIAGVISQEDGGGDVITQ